MKKYDSYKDSGIEWIGEIPSHWDFFNLKFILREGVKDGPHETPVWYEEGIPFLSIDGIINGEISFEKCRYIDEEQFEKFSKKLIIEKDDIFIGKAASIGKIARVKTDRKFTVWSPIAVVKVKKEYNPIFVEYYFRSDIVQHQIELLSTSNTQKNIAMGDIPKMKFIAPSEEEQTAIANYLDQKTTQIDDLIAKKERLIQLLEEERTAIINQAVTKGLDPTVPMKDSGIEWLGEIPAHWEVKRMNFISTKIGDGLHGTPNYVDESVFPFINGNNIGEGVIMITDRTKFVSEEEYITNQKTLTSKTILMSINGTIGNLAFYNGESIMLGKSVAYINLESHVNKDFIYYYLKSEIAKDYISMELSGSTIKNLSLYSINKTPIPYPAKDEQLEIVNYIKTKMLEIGTIISKTQQEIELLKEYKTALISEVVTGKVDVREEKIN